MQQLKRGTLDDPDAAVFFPGTACARFRFGFIRVAESRTHTRKQRAACAANFSSPVKYQANASGR
jgi:hypothetical protein